MKNLQKTNLNKQLKIEKFFKEQLRQLLLITAFVCACVLGNWSLSPKTLTFRNDGVGATFSNVVVNIEKVV